MQNGSVLWLGLVGGGRRMAPKPTTQDETPQKGHHSNCSSRRDLDVFFSDSNRHDGRDEGQREEEGGGGEGEGEGDGQLEEGGRDEGD